VSVFFVSTPTAMIAQKKSLRLSPTARMLAGAVIYAWSLMGGSASVRASDAGQITAVYSEVSPGYIRAKTADGGFEPEGFAFGNGGYSGGSSADVTIDRMSFVDVARIVSTPLAAEHYVSARAPANTRLLIMVYWGTTPGVGDASTSDAYQGVMAGHPTQAMEPLSTITIASEEATAMTPDSEMNVAIALNNAAIAHQRTSLLDGMIYSAQAENRARDKADVQNAIVLGYYPELVATAGFEHTALGIHRHDLIEDLENDRYYIVLMAYDFQAIWKQKHKKLLWVTRISVIARRNDFGKVLPAMTKFASRYFGQDSHGLLRAALPLGRVDIGELKLMGTEEKK
jgi:hypothetical protein